MTSAMQAIRAALVDGLGVEDVAARNGVDVAVARAAVAHLRETGQLAPLMALRLQRQRGDAQ